MPFISSIKGTGTIFSQEFLALACLFRVRIVSAPFPKSSIRLAEVLMVAEKRDAKNTILRECTVPSAKWLCAQRQVLSNTSLFAPLARSALRDGPQFAQGGT